MLPEYQYLLEDEYCYYFRRDHSPEYKHTPSEDRPVCHLEKVKILKVGQNVQVEHDDGRKKWYPVTVLSPIEKPFTEVAYFLGVEKEDSTSRPNEKPAIDRIARFKKPEWGSVRIPKYHHSTEALIADFAKKEGGLPSHIYSLSQYVTENNWFSPAFVEMWHEQKRIDKYFFELNTSFLSDQFRIVMSLGVCGDRGAVVNWVDYYNTEYWEYVRGVMLDIYHGTCCLCGSKESLHVHHKNYNRIGCELVSDLSVLCANCHKQYHKSKKAGDLTEKVRSFVTAFKALEDSL